MRTMIGRVAVAAGVLLAAIQVVRPTHTNPVVDPARTLQGTLPSHPGVPVVARACENCHSNQTNWPWYSHVAPVSWLVAHDVKEAREALNFSEWAGYSAERQRKLLRESCSEVKEGEMPMSAYVLMHPEAKLTAGDVTAICGLGASN